LAHIDLLTAAITVRKGVLLHSKHN
jgi:hypothetical protein